MSKKKLENFEKSILNNIEKDREAVDAFLLKITDYINVKGEEMYGKDFSLIMMAAAKLVENSQRSNEQIVRLLEMYNKKKEAPQGPELSQEEVENIYKEEIVET